jgi:hypothetical protein
MEGVTRQGTSILSREEGEVKAAVVETLNGEE